MSGSSSQEKEHGYQHDGTNISAIHAHGGAANAGTHPSSVPTGYHAGSSDSRVVMNTAPGGAYTAPSGDGYGGPNSGAYGGTYGGAHAASCSGMYGGPTDGSNCGPYALPPGMSYGGPPCATNLCPSGATPGGSFSGLSGPSDNSGASHGGVPDTASGGAYGVTSQDTKSFGGGYNQAGTVHGATPSGAYGHATADPRSGATGGHHWGTPGGNWGGAPMSGGTHLVAHGGTSGSSYNSAPGPASNTAAGGPGYDASSAGNKLSGYMPNSGAGEGYNSSFNAGGDSGVTGVYSSTPLGAQGNRDNRDYYKRDSVKDGGREGDAQDEGFGRNSQKGRGPNMGERGAYRGGSGRGGSRSGSGRDGDWICPNPSCGNLNFARRVECNKCSTPVPASAKSDRGRNGGGYGKGTNDDRYADNRGRSNNYDNRNLGGYRNDDRRGRGDSAYDNRAKHAGTQRSDSYTDNPGRRDSDYSHMPPPEFSPRGNTGGNYQIPPNAHGVNREMDVIPPSTNFSSGGPTSYPPSYSGGVGASFSAGGPVGARGGFGGRGSGTAQNQGNVGVTDPRVGIKQCDNDCDDTCDNSRIYISNLPPDVTSDELRELFGGIGQVGRIKQKRGYKDQWPWNIKLYTDDRGNNKGDAVLSYEDPSAAHSAGGFYNNFDMRGYKINVAMAEKTALRQEYGNRGRGNYGGDRPRDDYRDRNYGGPDRHAYGGNRTRPY